MKEFIVDFELWEKGVATSYLQNAFTLVEDEDPEYSSSYAFFLNYAKKHWNVYEGVRIKNIWVIEV